MLFSISKILVSASLVVGCAVFVLFAGCKEEPQIVTHRIPKSQSGLEDLRNEAADPDNKSEAAPAKFPTPDGWTRGKSNPMFPTEKFLKDFDGNEVVLSIMSLPASNDWESNVQRWLGQVGMEKSLAEIKSMTTQVPVDGKSSSKVRLLADDSDSQAIVGIMALKRNTAWFIKLMGEKAAVESAESEFDAYVDSIKLP
ncbi:hypothetical protein [Mariniblastus fucicola]|uniref:hypothetical protein n=1 Tax=Mariniblastus fucicola TaxID=980251 RepID=UPI00094618EF|nr:hypothetical protein [Mariniblastus fucicola]